MSAGRNDTGVCRDRPELAEVAARLLRSVAAGDRAALGRLYDGLAPLFTASVSIVQADAEVRDRLCVQAFAAVWRRATEGASSTEPVLWLLEVLCETLVESREAFRRPSGTGVLSLGCPQREVLLLAVAGHYSQFEISGLTGVPEAQVRVILCAALASLRGGLDEVRRSGDGE
ncbi:RNA polymerase sigma factor [Rathayibacter toxicus]|uniref:RNA polymerase sigma factor n=1 Tax=Rathayibacter toxicus TaxID=145458 RepID=UPI0011B0E1A5|nr:hypothetical protein [Rathayibacter toxicus]QOD10503.1 hypothetical protein BSG36_00375 [Rathayibacter toxicus]QWL27238.1 hypothetical protein E2R33_00365 [Rathayibacter toxicus]QWL31455.1 hypothetical protein E2R35_00345 [Rathayibacter toxicus]QWL33546.1 hypothetical protein E2R36_00345 [Rathayibacter toxicus]QWL35681.1 hypothetical protein E2R37_00345 [Rathayibacter toxicus]